MDGLRGLLALLVLCWHVTERLGLKALYLPSQGAVVCFFILSGYVLTRGWDGRYLPFLARRFVRLWPVYALTLAIGYFAAGVWPQWSQFLWYPLLSPNAKPEIDVPIWSLRIEAWAMLFMPFFHWSGTGKPWRALVALIAIDVASGYYSKLDFGMFFVIGAYLSRWTFRSRFLESALPQALGRVSYSLYLSHWIVFSVADRAFGRVGVIASIPLAFAIGWAIWRGLERPSISWSRRCGDLLESREPTRVAAPEPLR